MRKYLLLVALLATSNAFAWSLDARPPTKPVCDRIDTDAAPARSIAKPTVATHDDTTVVADTGSVAVAPTPIPPRSGGMGLSRVHNAPRWQSFLPGMFK